METSHGEQNENVVGSICHRIFGCDFVLRSPKLIEPSGAKELTDFLIWVDDTLVVIQSKSIAIEASDLDPLKSGRILKRHEDAKRQLNTTLNAHARGALVRAVTPLDITFDLDWSHIRRKIGIITLHLPDSQYRDPEFRFQYSLVPETHKDITVHTFLVNDLAQMVSELSTPGDFLSYLEIREKCLKLGTVWTGNELDLLAMFKSRYPELEKAIAHEHLLMIAPGIWEAYRRDSSGQICERDERMRLSGLIDRLIRMQHTSVDFSAAQFALTAQQSAINYMRTIGKFGKLCRIERAEIGKMIAAKWEKTKVKKRGYFLYVSKPLNTAYVFLLINEADREKRRDQLMYLCEKACYRVKQCEELVGVATEGAQSKGSSFDVVVMGVAEITAKPEPDPEINILGEPNEATIQEWSKE